MRRLFPILALAACGPDPVREGPTAAPTPEPTPGVVSGAEPAERAEDDGSQAAPEGTLLVTDPKVLAELEARGYGLGEAAFARPAPNLGALRDEAKWRAVTKAIEADLRGDKAADPKAGVGMRVPHRQFDAAWLVDERVRFELSAVVNRYDREPFARETCGETRLLYRLAYRAEVGGGQSVDSRLPMTVNLVFTQPRGEEGCAQAWARWVAAKDADALAGPEGPLTKRGRLVALEVNLQSMRWPSLVHPSLGGHAEYVMRVFHPRGDTVVAAPLENTPDVARLRKNTALKRELLDWLRAPETQAALDEGTVKMPDRFAATVVRSTAPRGEGRLGNRPWSQLFRETELAGVAGAEGVVVSDAASALRRLDQMSCNGCHQTRSIAGFHALGEPRDAAAVIDTLAVPNSPHLHGELTRRASDFARRLAGEAGSDQRPWADEDASRGRHGAHCWTASSGRSDLQCAEGFECVDTDGVDVGTCVAEGEGGAGAPCELGSLKTRAKAVDDRVREVHERSCQARAVCNGSDVGFPVGMCATGCDDLAEGEACGLIPTLTDFNACLARRTPFADCIVAHANPAGMRHCDAANPCRDDYVCARAPDVPEGGVCLPPYFLFQLRVDGHAI